MFSRTLVADPIAYVCMLYSHKLYRLSNLFNHVTFNFRSCHDCEADLILGIMIELHKEKHSILMIPLLEIRLLECTVRYIRVCYMYIRSMLRIVYNKSHVTPYSVQVTYISYQIPKQRTIHVYIRPNPRAVYNKSLVHPIRSPYSVQVTYVSDEIPVQCRKSHVYIWPIFVSLSP